MSKAKKLAVNVKFEYIDLLDMMGRIVEVHTEHYKSDFDIDKEILWSASDTWENNTFCYYLEQKADTVLVFIIEVTGYTPHTVGCWKQEREKLKISFPASCKLKLPIIP